VDDLEANSSVVVVGNVVCVCTNFEGLGIDMMEMPLGLVCFGQHARRTRLTFRIS
jgi:hypothetical protein